MSFRKFTYKAMVLTSLIACLNVSTVLATATGVVNANNLNIRSEATTQGSNILGTVSNGQLVAIQGAENGFYMVSFSNMDGVFLSDQYIDLEKVTAFVANASSAVNIRKLPSTDASIAGKVKVGDKVEVAGKVGDWYKIIHGNEDAFVHGDFLSGEFLPHVKELDIGKYRNDNRVSNNDKLVVVRSSTGLNLRKEASNSSDILNVLKNGERASYIAAHGSWVEVNYNGKIGFLSSDFISLGDDNITPAPSQATASEIPHNSSLAEQIISYGKQFLGTPYVYGGTDLDIGVDCSGFVFEVMRKNGINLNRSSREQANNGRTIPKSELKKGDLVFFDTNSGPNNGTISHVGIYMGNGQFIHSSSSKRTWGITISALSEDYYTRTYVKATRVLN